MLNFCGIVVAILKMETGRNFSMSGINSGHHNLPTYEISLKSNNVEFVRIVAAILKMATGRNFSMVRWMSVLEIFPQNLGIQNHHLLQYFPSTKWPTVFPVIQSYFSLFQSFSV